MTWKSTLGLGPKLVGILVLFIGLQSCMNDGPTEPETPGTPPYDPNTVLTTISGIASDEFGNPVAGARIAAHGRTAITGDNGEFFLPGLRVPRVRCFISCTGLGYFPTSHGALPVEDGVTQFRLILSGDPTTHSVDATSGGTVTLSDGSTVEVPAGQVITPDSLEYAGPVSIAARHFDPTAPGFSLRIPGGDLAALGTSPDTTLLFAFGAAQVELRGPDGGPLLLAPGATSDLSLTVPDSLLATAPGTVPLWYVEATNGMWVQGGVATLQGTSYVGVVDHYGTAWVAAEAAVDLANVCGRVVDPRDRAISGAVVRVGQAAAVTDTDGRFCRIVDARRTARVRVDAELNIGIATPAIDITSLAVGQAADAGDLTTNPVAHVTGTLQCGTLVTAGGVAARFGGARLRGTVTDASGNFDLAAPALDTATLVAYGFSNGRAVQRTIATPEPDSTLSFDTLHLCSALSVYVLVQSPRNNANITENVVNVQGTVSDKTIATGTLLVNGRSQLMGLANGDFSSTAVLAPGVNTLRVRVVNAAGTVGAAQISVQFTGELSPLTANLTWDTNTTDIDLHMINPNGDECYFGDKNIGGMKLDVDDVNGYGPENLSVVSALDGSYLVRIRNYRNSVPTTATVRVYKGYALIDEQTHLFDTTPVDWDMGTYILP